MKERYRNISAVHLYLKYNGCLLLSRRYNTGYYDGNYSVPAGHLDKDETIFDCIIRETKEETGLILKKEHLRLVHIMSRKPFDAIDEYRCDFFIMPSHWDGDILNKETEKCDDLSFFDLRKKVPDNQPIRSFPDNIVPYVKHAIDNIEKGVLYSEFIELSEF